MPSLFLAELLCLDSVDSHGDFKYRSIRNTDVAYARFLVKSQTLRMGLGDHCGWVPSLCKCDDQIMKNSGGIASFVCIQVKSRWILLRPIGLLL